MIVKNCDCPYEPAGRQAERSNLFTSKRQYMIKNYFKTAIRYLLRNKGYMIINTLGLAIGIACCILISLFVRSEWSYDRFHSKADRLHRVWLQEKYEEGQVFTNTITPIPLGPTMHANIPDIESFCRVNPFNTLVE